MEMTEWKSRIDNSPFFALDPVLEAARRDKEKYRLLELLILFGYEHINRHEGREANDGCPFGEEVWKTAEACLEFFDAEKGGSIFNYYVSALNRDYYRWTGKRYYDDLTHGLKINKKKMALIRKLIRQEESLPDGNVKSVEFLSMVSAAADISEKETEQYMKLILEGVQDLNAEVGNEEGDSSAEYMDFQADPKAEAAISAVSGSGYIDGLELIRVTFDGLQNRSKQKSLLSMLITASLFEREEVWDAMRQYPFYDEKIFKLCLERNKIITSREIAELAGQNEAAVSRSWKEFKRKLSERRCA